MSENDFARGQKGDLRVLVGFTARIPDPRSLGGLGRRHEGFSLGGQGGHGGSPQAPRERLSTPQEVWHIPPSRPRQLPLRFSPRPPGRDGSAGSLSGDHSEVRGSHDDPTHKSGAGMVGWIRLLAKRVPRRG